MNQLQQGRTATSSPFVTSVSTPPVPRERSIEDVLKEIEMEGRDTLNSAGNLADILGGSQPQNIAPEGKNADIPTHFFWRLEQILQTVRQTNQELGRAHHAIHG